MVGIIFLLDIKVRLVLSQSCLEKSRKLNMLESFYFYFVL